MSGISDLMSTFQQGYDQQMKSMGEHSGIRGFADGGYIPVWTGTGYEQIPTEIAASDLRYTPGFESGASSDGASGQWNPGSMGFTDEARARYGNMGTMNATSNNWMSMYDPNDPNSMKVMVKSADKAGTIIPYTLKDGRWTADTSGVNTVGWNTNPTASDYMPYAIISAFAAPALMSAAGVGAGTGGITMMPAENLFEGATLAANAPTAAGVGEAVGGGIASLSPTVYTGMNPALDLLPEGITPSMTSVPTAAAPEAVAPTSMLGEGVDTASWLASQTPAGMSTTEWLAANGLTASQIAAAAGGAPAVAAPTFLEGLGGISGIAGDIGQWVVRNPQAALGVAGAIGSLFENGNTGTPGGGAAGGGGWQGPIPKFDAVQTRYAAPAGYRPGFDPEHVYIRTSYGPQGAAAGAQQQAPGELPPVVPKFADGGIVAIDPSSAFTGSMWARPAGITAIPRYPRFAGAAGGPAYVPQEPAGGLAALFHTLNTPGTAAPRAQAPMTPEQDNARWTQAGFNPTRTNNRTPSTGTATRQGATRAGFGGYGIPKFATGGFVEGPGTGTSDSIPATINGDQPARLSDGEFVLPAWFVKAMGNGSSDAGAQRLYAMMDQVKRGGNG